MSADTVEFPDSLWRKTAVDADLSPQLEGDHDCDVTIVGAGFTGLRAAIVLAEAGTRVVVLDAGDVGWGASGRNGGQVNPMLPFNGPDQLTKLVGSKFAERLTDVSLNSANELFELIEAYQIECQARQQGWLRVDHCAAARKKSQKNALEWNRCGANMEIVEGEALRKLTGSPAYKSGVLAPSGGAVQPMSLARGWARIARSAGVKIYGRSKVDRLDKVEGGWSVHTARGSCRSSWVILATNGYSDGLLSGLSQTILPVTPIQIGTEPLDEVIIGDILPGGQTISDTRRVIMYARREPDNRMVFGGLGKPLPSGGIGGHDWLIQDAIRIFPQLKNVAWTTKWGGHVAVTHDHLPHIHEPEKGLIAGLGYNGRGVAMSHVMGRTLAARVLGKDPSDLAFPTTDITKIPFRGLKQFGFSTAVWLMRLRDRLEVRQGG